MTKNESKTAQAIAELKQQLDNYPLDIYKNPGWKAATGDLIRLYTGEHSTYYDQYQKWLTSGGLIDTYEYMDRQRQKATDLLKNVIAHIERRGVYKAPKTFFLSRLTSEELIGTATVLISIITGSFLLGQYVGGNQKTEQSVKMQITIDSLRRVIGVNRQSAGRIFSSIKIKNNSEKQDNKQNKD